MGRDKALMTVEGETLLNRQVRVLRAAGASEVLINQHPDRPRAISQLPPEVRLVWDDAFAPDAGPLAGLAAVLSGARNGLVAVVAVDLPALTSRWWNRLLERVSAECGAVGQLPGGSFEPLAAIYSRRALPRVLDRLAGREYALQTLVREGVNDGWMRPMLMSDADQAELLNWNSADSGRAGTSAG